MAGEPLPAACRTCCASAPRPTCCLPLQKPLEFLRSCWVEVCANPGRRSQGACKASKQPFQRGDVRLVTTAGEPTMRVYLSLPAAAEKLQPVLQLVGPDAFSPTDVAGLEDLPAADRAAFFEVGAGAAACPGAATGAAGNQQCLVGQPGCLKKPVHSHCLLLVCLPCLALAAGVWRGQQRGGRV